MSSPYRAPPPSSPGAARELVCEWRDPDARVEALRAALKVFFAAAIAGGLVGLAGLPEATVVALIGGAAWGIRRQRTAAGSVSAVVLRVENGALSVTSRAGAPLLQVPLRSLDDVELDTTSIAPVERDTALGAAGVGAARTGVPVDVSRVVLIPRAPGDPVPITEARIPYADAVESAGKIRAFLRSHGWLPEDERADPPR